VVSDKFATIAGCVIDELDARAAAIQRRRDRLYLMAHAPDEPQAWFSPKVAERPMQPLPGPPDGYESMARRSEFEHKVSEYKRAINVWTYECEKQRLLQWPAAWADEQLKVLDGGSK
jgi:hypothetical protein